MVSSTCANRVDGVGSAAAAAAAAACFYFCFFCSRLILGEKA